MKLRQLLFLIIIPITSSNLAAQNIHDTLQLATIKQMTKLSDLYPLPSDKDQLDHFVAFISLPGIDPIAAYNRGNDFIPNTIENINMLTHGSKLSLLVYTINTEHPDSGPIKLPMKEYFIR